MPTLSAVMAIRLHDHGARPAAGSAAILPGPPLLFLHIMKTAGTSFRTMLQDALGMDAVYPSDRDLAGLPNGWYRQASDILATSEQLPTHRVLVGHFPAVLADRLPRRYRVVTFLRDPVQRSLSMLRHVGRMGGMTPAELIDTPLFAGRAIRDYQTRRLGTPEIDTSPQGPPVDDAMLDRALARLETLDFVGITERFAESCVEFDRRFGTDVAVRARQENVGRESPDELSELIPRIEPLVRRDQVLYERAVSLLASRCTPTLRAA